MSTSICEMAGYTGRLFEDEFVPQCREGANAGHTGYLPYRAAMETARKNQPEGWDPSEPDPMKYRWASDLHTMVAGCICPDDYSSLSLVTSRGTAMDRFHGVDAFFEHGGRVATVDLTLNPAKAGGYKADVVVLMGQDGDLEHYAREIADCLGYRQGAEAA